MIHISKVHESDAVRLVVTRQLKEHGIKLPRKLSTPLAIPLGVGQPTSQLGLPLVSKYFKKKVLLPHGTVKIPRILHDTVIFLSSHLHTEGLFRKTGSLSRQRELISFLEKGVTIPVDSHVHDVANLMKRFFRELPEPLLTNRLLPCFEGAYEMFHNDKEKFHSVVLLLCLLLPRDHRHALEWTMNFISSVAANSDKNKMDTENLATILTPNVMRCTKVAIPTKRQLRSYTAVVVALIDINKSIGFVSCDVHESVNRLGLRQCRNDCGARDRAGSVEADGQSEVGEGKTLEELGAKQMRKKRRSRSLSGFISGIGHSLGRLTGSRRSESRKIVRPTVMEIHDRLAADIVQTGGSSHHVENTEDREEDPMDSDSSPPPPQPRAVPILDGRSLRKTMPGVKIESLASETPAKQQQMRRSPAKRKAPEDSALFSASKRQAILRGGLLPSVAASGCKMGTQIAPLKRGNGTVTVTPRRVLRPRLRTSKREAREVTESPDVREIEKEEVDCHSSRASSGSPKCSSEENGDGATLPAVGASPMLVKQPKKRKKRRSGLFKLRSDDYEELQEELNENTQTDKTPISTEPAPKKRSLSQRLKRLSDSVFRSPARLVKSRSEDNMLSEQQFASHGVGARLAGEDLSIGDSEDLEADHRDFQHSSVTRRNILGELQSLDVLDGRGLRMRSVSCHNFLAEASSTVHSVMEWIL